MGTLLSKQEDHSYDSQFVKIRTELKKIKMSYIFEVLQYIHEEYPTCHKMVYEIFNDIFGSLVFDTRPIFDRLNEFGLVDIYEALVTFVFFSQEEYENKLVFIFRLFDFDSSLSLNQDELIKTFQIVLKSVCKIAGLKYPDGQLTTVLSQECFNMIDVDQSGLIDFIEFKDWVDQDFQMQNFLLKYAKTNTYINGKRRMLQELQIYEKGFLQISNGQKFAQNEDVKNYLTQLLKQYDIKLVDKLFQIIENYSKKNKIAQDLGIRKSDFLEVMKVWASFSASDYDQEDQLHINDLKILIWIYEDAEPDQFRMNLEMKKIDADLSNTIDRMEWVQYIMDQDKNNKLKSSLRKAFDKLMDQNEFIEYKSIKQILFEAYVHESDMQLNNFVQEKKRQNIMKFSKEIQRVLKERKQDKELFDWFDFKQLIDEQIEANKNLYDSIIDPQNIKNQISIILDKNQIQTDQQEK